MVVVTAVADEERSGCLVGFHAQSSMDPHGYAVVRPRLPSPDMPTRPLLDFGAGYVQRALSQLPRQGTSGPWVMAMDPNHDAQVLRHGPVADPCLVFDTASRPRHPVAAPKQVAVSA